MIEVTFSAKPYANDWFPIENGQSYTSDGLRWQLPNRHRHWRPPTDMYETEDAFIVRVEIAGMRETDFTISLHDRRLMIGGIRPDTNERRAYHQMELPFGEFSTEVDLPVPVAADAVEAVYRDGFLRISLPKAQPRHIHIKE